MYRTSGAAILVIGALFFSGCNQSRTSDRSLQTISAIDADSLRNAPPPRVGSARRTVFVDPRPVYEFRQSHIPGAIHMPYETLREAHFQLDGYDTIIVYGTGFSSTIAVAASKTLLELGHTDVRTLQGGLNAWIDADLDID